MVGPKPTDLELLGFIDEMKRNIFALFIFYSCNLFAQDQLNELTVDRPGIAESPYTVRPGMFQLETGLDYYDRLGGEIFFLPVSLFRVGLSENSEFRISAKNVTNNTFDESMAGISPVSLGIKTHIIHQNGWRPETDILVNVIVPIGNSPLQPGKLGHEVLLLFQNDFSEKYAINYNVGLIWDGFSEESIFTTSLCFNYLPTEKIGLFAEYFNFIRYRDAEEFGIDGGLTYLLHPHIQADASVGFSWVDQEICYFISTGLSFRVVRSKPKLQH